MTVYDETITTYTVREVIAGFHSADSFEQAVEKLEQSGFDRDSIHMMASHDAVQNKLGNHFTAKSSVQDGSSLPQGIYDDKHDVSSEKSIAVGVPVYVGGLGAGLAVVATGGALAFAAVIAAAGAAVGAGVGSLIARSIGKHHAEFIEKQLSMGALLVMVEVNGEKNEKKAIKLLEDTGGENVHAHSLTKHVHFDEKPLGEFNPYAFENYSGWV